MTLKLISPARWDNFLSHGPELRGGPPHSRATEECGAWGPHGSAHIQPPLQFGMDREVSRDPKGLLQTSSTYLELEQ